MGAIRWFIGGGVLVALTALSTIMWRTASERSVTTDFELTMIVGVKVAAGVVFLLLLPRLFRSTGAARAFLIGMLLIGGGMRLAALPPAPAWEDDFYRYLWDGAVLAHGVNPYQFAPEQVEAALAGETEIDPTVLVVAEQGRDTLAHVNHPHLRTIYPPLAQAWFAAAHWIGPWQLNAWRAVILLHDVATLVLLVLLVRAIGPATAFVGVYWMNPLVVSELYQTAHMDILVLPWVLAALWAACSGRFVAASAALAAGVAVKLWPVILLPFVLRPLLKRPLVLVSSCAVFAALSFVLLLPMITHETSHAADSGAIRYAEAWQNNAGFFELHRQAWAFVLPAFDVHPGHSHRFTRMATATLLALWLGWLSWRPLEGARDLTQRCFWAIAVLFLISPTQFPWYFLWVVPLLVLSAGAQRPRGVPTWPLLLYVPLLPLYHLQDIAPWMLWIQHTPVWAMLTIETIRTCLSGRTQRSDPSLMEHSPRHLVEEPTS